MNTPAICWKVRSATNANRWRTWREAAPRSIGNSPGSEDECRAFYCEILGWRELPKPEALIKRGGLWLHTGDADIHFGVEKDFRPAKKAHPAFLVDDVSSIAQNLENGGYAPDWDDSIPAFKRFFVFDAVGNRLEFMQVAEK